MYGDVGIVEVACAVILAEGEVVYLYARGGAVGQVYLPVCTLHLYYIDIIEFLVEKGV